MASKKEFIEDNFSDHSIDDDTMPDEEFNLFKIYRDKLPSYPDIEKKGPNINLKIQHKRYNTQKEKEFFLRKKKKRRRQNCVKLMRFIIIKMIAVLHMVWKNSEKIRVFLAIR